MQPGIWISRRSSDSTDNIGNPYTPRIVKDESMKLSIYYLEMQFLLIKHCRFLLIQNTWTLKLTLFFSILLCYTLSIFLVLTGRVRIIVINVAWPSTITCNIRDINAMNLSLSSSIIIYCLQFNRVLKNGSYRDGLKKNYGKFHNGGVSKGHFPHSIFFWFQMA